MHVNEEATPIEEAVPESTPAQMFAEARLVTEAQKEWTVNATADIRSCLCGRILPVHQAFCPYCGHNQEENET